MRRILTLAEIVWLEMLRRKDLYVWLILLLCLLVVLLSFNAFGLGGAMGYAKELGLLMTWLFSWVLIVYLGAGQIPREETRGTAFPLLAKPVTRGEFIVGKWLGVWTMVGMATAAFYALVVLVLGSRGGRFAPFTLAQALILHLAALALIGAVAVALSTRLNADAAATLTYVFTIASFLFVPAVPRLILTTTGRQRDALMAIYYALPHFELFDMRWRLVHDWGPVSAGVLAAVLLYGMLWTAAVLLAGWLSYRKKRFSRGALL